jgi:hypothetical protein
MKSRENLSENPQEVVIMVTIPLSIRMQFQASLPQQAIPPHAQAAYLKWLQYYLDFCQKYHFPPEYKESLPHFLKKLQEKRQTQAQQEQAAHAIGLYYEMLASISAPTPSQEGSELSIVNWQFKSPFLSSRSQSRRKRRVHNLQTRCAC